MDHNVWHTLPFDDDDDEFGFDETPPELASELREYDGDDDEFDELERASVTIPSPAPLEFPAAIPALDPEPVPPPPPKRAPRNRPAAKAAPKKKK